MNTATEKDVIRLIDEISARGNHAEVKKTKNGYIVYEVSKKIRCGK